MAKINMTAQQVFDTLINEDKILEISGQIKFFLGDVKIIVKQKDVVGNIMQEWLEGWLKKRNVAYSVNPNTQMPPDFFLSPRDHKHNLLEIKAFNSDASPGFDIADFTMYSEEIIREPYMLDVDYENALRDTLRQLEKAINGNAMDGDWIAAELHGRKCLYSKA